MDSESHYVEKNDKSMPEKLNDAGISVSVGLLRDEAKQLNRGFFSRVINKKPFVTLKLGISIDGATAMESGESQWIKHCCSVCVRTVDAFIAPSLLCNPGNRLNHL